MALDTALAAINVLPPTYEPGATGHVPEIVELIEQLIARGHAYAAEDGSGDVAQTTQLSYRWSNLPNGQAQSFRVRAYNRGGWGS